MVFSDLSQSHYMRKELSDGLLPGPCGGVTHTTVPVRDYLGLKYCFRQWARELDCRVMETDRVFWGGSTTRSQMSSRRHSFYCYSHSGNICNLLNILICVIYVLLFMFDFIHIFVDIIFLIFLASTPCGTKFDAESGSATLRNPYIGIRVIVL